MNLERKRFYLDRPTTGHCGLCFLTAPCRNIRTYLLTCFFLTHLAGTEMLLLSLRR